MKVRDIIGPYVDLDNIDPELLAELEDSLERKKTTVDPQLLQAIYGDEKRDLELAQMRLDLEKTMAEVFEIRASADRNRAEADTTRSDRLK